MRNRERLVLVPGKRPPADVYGNEKLHTDIKPHISNWFK